MFISLCSYTQKNSATMTNQPSYINAAAYAGLTFGVIISAITTVSGYMAINQEPSGSLFGLTTIAAAVSCLFGAFAGLFGARLYARETGIPIKLGTGAVLGVVTGLVIAFVATIIGVIWHFLIDTNFTENLMEATIANIEMMDMLPADAREDMIDGIYAQFQNQYTMGGIFASLGISALIYMALNAISGILGIKFFAEQPEESLDDV